MNIVFPVLALEKGGGARYIYQLANALQDKGHDVEIIIPMKAPLEWPLRTKITWVNELAPYVIPPADFIFANWWPTVKPAWETRKGKVIRLSSGYEPLWVKDKEAARQSYLIDAPIISMSEWHRQLLRQNTGRDSTVIHGGVDHTIFRPQAKPSKDTGRKSIFYISRSKNAGYFWKGNEDFWQACKLLYDQGEEFDLQIVMVENMHEPLPASLPYELKAARDDLELARLYAEADIFVSTSYFESFSLPQLEAMSCQTAVVTTDSGGTRDYARAGENCLIVPPSDTGQLAQAIARLLHNDRERERIALAGYTSAQPFSWQVTAAKTENLLYELKAMESLNKAAR